MLNFKQTTRQKEYRLGTLSIPFNQIRTDLDLRSAWFSVRVAGDSVVLDGRGYGHGVGLCQEGAMEMARVGYSWLDIVHFYFHDVKVEDYREMELHRFKPE